MLLRARPARRSRSASARAAEATICVLRAVKRVQAGADASTMTEPGDWDGTLPPDSGGRDVKATVHRPGELGRHEIDAWRAVQASDPRLASPFLAPEFAIALGETDRRARVAVIEDGSGALGFLPFTQQRHGLATHLGERAASGPAAMMRPPDLEVDVPRLLAQCGLHTIEFDEFIADPALPANGGAVTKDAHVIDLTQGFDRYAAALATTHGRLVSSLAKQRRRLRHRAGDVVFCADDRDPEALRQLLEWKSAQYVASGWRNPLANNITAGHTDIKTSIIGRNRFGRQKYHQGDYCHADKKYFPHNYPLFIP